MLKKVTPEDLRRYLVVNPENGNANYLGDVLKGCLIYDIAEQEPEKKEEKQVQEEPKEEPKNIDQLKVRALKSKCKDAGVSLEKLCQIYTVTKVEELTEVQFSNINQFWDRVVESCKAL